jgi:NADH-quinone oxidoreductase subunit K
MVLLSNVTLSECSFQLKPNAQGQVFALFSVAIAAAEVAVGLGIIIIAYRLYKEIDVEEFRSMRG